MKKFSSPQSGFSLLELTFATLISTLILGGAMVLLLSGEKFYEGSLVKARSTEQAKNVMALIEKELYLVSLKDLEVHTEKEKGKEKEKEKGKEKEKEKGKEKKVYALSYRPFLGWDTKKNKALHSKEKHVLQWKQKENSLWLIKPKGPPEILAHDVVYFEVGKILSPPVHLYILIKIDILEENQEQPLTKTIKKVFYLPKKQE